MNYSLETAILVKNYSLGTLLMFHTLLLTEKKVMEHQISHFQDDSKTTKEI